MRIVRTRAALLSDYEVLQLLRDAEEKQRAAGRSDDDAEAWMKSVPPNVRTIQFEVRRRVLTRPLSRSRRRTAPVRARRPSRLRAFWMCSKKKGTVCPTTRFCKARRA